MKYQEKYRAHKKKSEEIVVDYAKAGGKDHRHIPAAILHQDFTCRGKLCAPPLRNRIIKGDDEITGTGGVNAFFDGFPRCQQVGQRDGAEIMAQNGA